MIKKLLSSALLLIFVFISASCVNGSSDVVPITDSNPSDGCGDYSGMSFYDIYGEEHHDIFKDHKLTIVNLFATWCSPCVRELPELQKLSEEVALRDIAVVGIVTDACETGALQDSVIADAVSIAESAGVKYPMLIPDETHFKGYIDSLDAVPETLFIDGDGNILYSVVGSRDLDGWNTVLEKVENMLEK